MASPRRGPSILFEVFAASQRVRTLVADSLAGTGLRPDEYAVYSVLADGGPSSPTVMAHAVGMPATTMSHYVRAMSERGHAERRRNPADGRSTVIALTAAGRAAHRRAAVAFEQGNAQFLDALAPSDPEVRATLRAIGAAAKAATDALAGSTLDAAG